jgi:pyruvate,water dikinase
LIEPYPDGRWFPNEHRVSPRFPLLCRGNAGEVYPNVVTPLTGSIVAQPFSEGQRRLSIDAGLATPDQLRNFDGVTYSVVGMFAGYLYANVSLARSAAARTPGLTAADVDQQMFGLTGAPPSRRGPGDRSPRAAMRTVRFIAPRVFRPNDRSVAEVRRLAADALATAPDIHTATDDELLAVVHRDRAHLDRMMYELISAGFAAGVGRAMLERLLTAQGGDGLINRLTAGLGTIESAEPATELWRLGRHVAEDDHLTELFDDGTTGLDERLRADPGPAVAAFVRALDDFRVRHGARGPEEWELASPTWGSDPGIALAQIDRLRRAPSDRAPGQAAAAAERDALVAEVRARVGAPKRPMFDRALRAAMVGQANREATKAALIRLLWPMRQALAELGRRSGLPHDDFFLLLLPEVPVALADPDAFAEPIAERRARRDFLQARVPPFWFEGEVPDPRAWPVRTEQLRPDRSPRTLTGLGVCSGTATGRARVVTDPAAPGDLAADDILVAPITDPSWTPLFLAAAGVVVDVGAQMSHAAIVSRELGIPAVVSVTGASTTIPDGVLLTVNGDEGTVTVHG